MHGEIPERSQFEGTPQEYLLAKKKDKEEKETRRRKWQEEAEEDEIGNKLLR